MAPDLRLSTSLPLRLWYVREASGLLAGALGPELAGRAARWLGCGVFQLNGPARRFIEGNLALAFPGVPPQDREHIAQRTFENVAAFWSEALLARRRLTRSAWKAAIEVIEPARWEAISRRPTLLVSSYFGNPAAGAIAVSQLVPPVHVLVDPASHWVAKSLWKGSFRSDGTCRRLPGLKLMTTAEAPVGLPKAMQAGERVLVLLGRKTGDFGGVQATFFGQERRYSATVGRVALRHGADIGVFSCRRPDRPAAAHRLELLDHLPAARLPRTARGVIQRVVNVLEEHIRRCPEQFLWTRL